MKMTKFSFWLSESGSMEFKIFVTLAVLGLVFHETLAADNDTTNGTDSTTDSSVSGTAFSDATTTTDKSPATSTNASTISTAQQHNPAIVPIDNSNKGSTATTTTPAPAIDCRNGSCNGNSSCYNTSDFKTNFGSQKTCSSGERCAVTETVKNATFSQFILGCKSASDCKSMEEKGTGACCAAENCLPDLAKAKASAKAKAENHNGSCGLQVYFSVIIAMAIIILAII